MTRHHVAIIGAGPYGLAAAAYLRAANVETVVFGEPMQFWREQMPEGMLLRSSWEASQISDPHHANTLDAYETQEKKELSRPLPLQDFIQYGKWFQQRVVPDIERRQVARIEREVAGYRLSFADGEPLLAQHVVVATGIAKFAYRPPQFDGLPDSLISHASDHRDLQPFKGKRVIVLGGGQSAIETATLLQEVGAQVEVVMRAPAPIWLGRGGVLRTLPAPVRYLFYPPSDVGPPGLNWFVHLPALFNLLPPDLQERVAYRSIRPAASSWLKPRAAGIKMTTGCQVVSATRDQKGVCLELDDETKRRVDHVVLATGYRVNIARLGLFAPEVLDSIDRANGYPRLDGGFQSSALGLHFVGAPAALSFGPLLRFVAGSGYAASLLTRSITKQRPKRITRKSAEQNETEPKQPVGIQI